MSLLRPRSFPAQLCLFLFLLPFLASALRSPSSPQPTLPLVRRQLSALLPRQLSTLLSTNSSSDPALPLNNSTTTTTSNNGNNHNNMADETVSNDQIGDRPSPTLSDSSSPSSTSPSAASSPSPASAPSSSSTTSLNTTSSTAPTNNNGPKNNDANNANNSSSIVTPSASLNTTRSATAPVPAGASPRPSSSSNKTVSHSTENNAVNSSPTQSSGSSDSAISPASSAPRKKQDGGGRSAAGTTFKTIGIIGGVAAGLFLLWNIVRKWKFSPSKRFARKLEEYDDHLYTPRPPSFAEKRTGASEDQLPLRHSPTHSSPYVPHGSHAPYPAHRISGLSFGDSQLGRNGSQTSHACHAGLEAPYHGYVADPSSHFAGSNIVGHPSNLRAPPPTHEANSRLINSHHRNPSPHGYPPSDVSGLGDLKRHDHAKEYL